MKNYIQIINVKEESGDLSIGKTLTDSEIGTIRKQTIGQAKPYKVDDGNESRE